MFSPKMGNVDMFPKAFGVVLILLKADTVDCDGRNDDDALEDMTLNAEEVCEFDDVASVASDGACSSTVVSVICAELYSISSASSIPTSSASSPSPSMASDSSPLSTGAEIPSMISGMLKFPRIDSRSSIVSLPNSLSRIHATR